MFIGKVNVNIGRQSNSKKYFLWLKRMWIFYSQSKRNASEISCQRRNISVKMEETRSEDKNTNQFQRQVTKNDLKCCGHIYSY